MVNKEIIFQLLDEDRRTVHEPNCERIETRTTVRHLSRLGGIGRVEYSKDAPETIRAAIENEVQFFEGIGRDFEWKVFDHDQPVNLREELQAHGFAVGQCEALLVRSLTTAGEALPKQPSHQVRRITGTDRLDDYLTVTEQVWGREKSCRDAKVLLAALQSEPASIGLHVVYVENQPVCCGRMTYHFSSRIGWLWGGCTLPEFRRRGLYGDLLLARILEAGSMGFQYLFVDALPTSRPILERHGFTFVEFSHPCVWQTRKPK